MKWLAALLILLPLTAAAQGPCMPRADADKFLEEDYGEVVKWIGLMKNGNLARLHTSPDNTWTWSILTPGGVACFVASGEASQVIKKEILEKSAY